MLLPFLVTGILSSFIIVASHSCTVIVLLDFLFNRTGTTTLSNTEIKCCKPMYLFSTHQPTTPQFQRGPIFNVTISSAHFFLTSSEKIRRSLICNFYLASCFISTVFCQPMSGIHKLSTVICQLTTHYSQLTTHNFLYPLLLASFILILLPLKVLPSTARIIFSAAFLSISTQLFISFISILPKTSFLRSLISRINCRKLAL